MQLYAMFDVNFYTDIKILSIEKQLKVCSPVRIQVPFSGVKHTSVAVPRWSEGGATLFAAERIFFDVMPLAASGAEIF